MNPRPAGLLRHRDPQRAAHSLRTPGARPRETTDSIPATPGAWAAGNPAVPTQSGAQDCEFPRFPLMVTRFRIFLGHQSFHGCARFAIYYRLFSEMSICLVARFSKLAIIRPHDKFTSPGPEAARTIDSKKYSNPAASPLLTLARIQRRFADGKARRSNSRRKLIESRPAAEKVQRCRQNDSFSVEKR